MPGANCSRRCGMVALRGAEAAACAASAPQWWREGRARTGGKKEAAPSRRKGAASRRANDDRRSYFSAERAVSTDSLAMNVAPHQLEPGPPGLIGVEATPEAV